MRGCLKKSVAIGVSAFAAILVIGCAPDKPDPQQSSREAWKAQRAEQERAVQKVHQKASDLMRDFGVERP